MFRENHRLLPRPRTTGYQCDMLMAFPNAAIEYTTQGCVVTLCCAKKRDVSGEERTGIIFSEHGWLGWNGYNEV